jgi:hypothetical protein
MRFSMISPHADDGSFQLFDRVVNPMAFAVHASAPTLTNGQFEKFDQPLTDFPPEVGA